MYNKVIMLGHFTRDVELKYLPSGMATATIGLASNRRYKKQDGSDADETCFVDVKLFGRTAEIANQYLKKGSLVLIEGRLNYETWTDQGGSKRSKHTITAEALKMMPKNAQGGFGGEDSYSGYSNSEYSSAPASSPKPSEVPSIDVDADVKSFEAPSEQKSEDEIPF